MKNYFDFKLRGNEIFSYYLCIFISIIIYAYTSVHYTTATSNIVAGVVPADTPIAKELGMYIVGLFIYVVTVLIFSFHIIRDSVMAVSYKGEDVRFEGTLGEYLKISLLGYFLILISLGIYTPWFCKRVTDFYVKSTSYRNIKLRFKGTVLAILLINYISVFLILGVTFAFAQSIAANEMMVYPYLAIVYLIVSVVVFLEYRWFLNLSYDNFKIIMAKVNPSLGSLYMFKEIVLSVVTLGLYIPAAIIHISRFFVNRLEERNECGVVIAKFGADFSIKEDFIYVFAQCLLCVITFGIYIPWAFAKINRRLINKTYKINNY